VSSPTSFSYTTLFRSELGIVYERDLLAQGVDFTIGEARVRYHAPLRFDDEYDIRVRIGEIRHSSWTFEYAIDRADGAHCVDAKRSEEHTSELQSRVDL